MGYRYPYLKLSYMYNIIYRCMWNCRGCVNGIFNMYTLEKGAINVVEIETLIFVKYNVDKHIKNSARLCLICKINHIKREGKSKMTEEHYVHVLHIYWSHKFCIKWKIRLAETINFKEPIMYVLENMISSFISNLIKVMNEHIFFLSNISCW